MTTNTTTGQHYPALQAVLAQGVNKNDYVQVRVRWLLDLAAVLDTVHIDGAADLATAARDAALTLVGDRITTVAGRSA